MNNAKTSCVGASRICGSRRSKRRASMPLPTKLQSSRLNWTTKGSCWRTDFLTETLNLATYSTPGVYYERVDASAPAITPIRTDVAGFVGLASRGPLDTAVPWESWREFEAYVGGFTGAGFLAYEVRGFFENGGKRCWVVRVASNDPAGGATPAALELASTLAGRSVWSIAASSSGVWGNDLTVSLQETRLGQTVGKLDSAHPERLIVAGTAGFVRGTLVRLSQPAKSPVLRVIAAIDATQGFADQSPDAKKFLIWIPEQAALRLPYDSSPLNFDPDLPIVVESVEYTLVVEQKRIPVALYRGLSLVPEHPLYGPTFLGPLKIPTDIEARQVLPPLPQPVVVQDFRPECRPDSAA